MRKLLFALFVLAASVGMSYATTVKLGQLKSEDAKDGTLIASCGDISFIQRGKTDLEWDPGSIIFEKGTEISVGTDRWGEFVSSNGNITRIEINCTSIDEAIPNWTFANNKLYWEGSATTVELKGSRAGLTNIRGVSKATSIVITYGGSESDCSNPSGDCGANLSWVYYKYSGYNNKDSLVITGSGAMNDYTLGYPTPAPWLTNAETIIGISLPEGLTRIGDKAFCGCNQITSVTVPESVTAIGSTAFQDCSSLATISIPNTLAAIGGSAFERTALTQFTIPDGVSSLAGYVFGECTSLNTVTIHSGVTSLTGRVFYNCTGLTSVYCHVTTPITIDNKVFDGVNKANCTLYVPSSSVAAYQAAAEWNGFSIEPLPISFKATAGSGGFNDDESHTKLFDGKFRSGDGNWTKWCTNGDGKSVPTDESESCWWVDFEASEAANFLGYTLTTGNDNASEHGRNPKNWVLKAKLNQEDAWTIVSTVTNDDVLQDENFTDYNFVLDVPGTYKYFRYEVTATKGSNVLQLCELRVTNQPFPVSYKATNGSGGFSDDESHKKLFDGKYQSGDGNWTKWCTNGDRKSVPTDESESCWWVDFEASESVGITGYILTTGNDNASEHNRNPKDWVLKAKLNESDAWTTIATVTNDGVLQNENFTDYNFVLDVPGTYKYFRYEVTATQGSDVLQLCELRFTNDPITVSGTITACGWSTFASSLSLDLSTLTATSGATAYYASAASGSTVTLTATTATVPAGEGIMIKGTAGETFSIDGVVASGTAIEGNLLKGQTTTGNVAASVSGTYHYIFGFRKPDLVVTEYGFYNLAADTEVPAGKAYLETTGAIAAPGRFLVIEEAGIATNIDNFDVSDEAIKFIENGRLYIKKNGVVYDLLGTVVR